MTDHFLIYGDPGSGKTTGAATFPTPQLVHAFDPRGKERPYLWRGGQPRGTVATGTDEDGTPVTEVADPATGDLVVRVEYFLDADPQRPEAFGRYLRRLQRLKVDLSAWQIQTLIIDSVTFLELAARKEQQYVLNPRAKEPRQWFSGATDSLEEVLMMRVGALACRVVVLAHIDEDKDELHGTFVRNPKAPGRLRKGMAAGYTEFYRAHVVMDEHGARRYVWQTRANALYNASTQLGTPDGCEQDFANCGTGRA